MGFLISFYCGLFNSVFSRNSHVNLTGDLGAARHHQSAGFDVSDNLRVFSQCDIAGNVQISLDDTGTSEIG